MTPTTRASAAKFWPASPGGRSTSAPAVWFRLSEGRDRRPSALVAAAVGVASVEQVASEDVGDAAAEDAVDAAAS